MLSRSEMKAINGGGPIGQKGCGACYSAYDCGSGCDACDGRSCFTFK
ncbi:hypothetical protein [Flavobacterium sp. N502540]|nr:hypothetical protein [Flavobacterium sp. N502540]